MMYAGPRTMLHTSVLHGILRSVSASRDSRIASTCPSLCACVMNRLCFWFHVDVRWSAFISGGRQGKNPHNRRFSACSDAPVKSTGSEAIVGSSEQHGLELAESEAVAEYCRDILYDPISDVSVEETSKFLIPYPKNDRTYLFEVLTRPFRENYMYEPASMMLHLCVERLENDELTSRFDIGPGFNRRAYFLVLHVWILHRRAMKESPLGILLDKYLFQFTFELFKEWLHLRKVPEHRFKKEHENCQAFMMKFLVELDQATLDEELYPYKLSQVLRNHMYEFDVDESILRLLVKYVLRQFAHICNLEQKPYLDAMFLWADTESICKPRRLLKRAMPQLITYGGYEPTPSKDKTEQLGPGPTKLTEY